MKFIIMIGEPGSGKSTYINQHKQHFGSCKVHSRDEVRFRLVKEGEPYFSRENEVFKTWIAEMRDSLKNNELETVIADATHLSVAGRRKLINALGSSLDGVKIIGMVMPHNVERSLAQNENRKGTRSYVPETAIRNMASSYEVPTLDEEFDEIYFYNGKSYTSVGRTE